MLRSKAVFSSVVIVNEDENQIEPAQQTRLDPCVRMNVILGVPLLACQQRISCSYNRGASVDLRDDASFGN